jgi:hypothetical protein
MMSCLLKRKYTCPNITTVKVDREISLIMMTSETDPPIPPVRGAPQQTSKFEQTNLQDNPFAEKQ